MGYCKKPTKLSLYVGSQANRLGLGDQEQVDIVFKLAQHHILVVVEYMLRCVRDISIYIY